MDVRMAQLLAIAAHGQVFLSGDSISGFYPDNSVFNNCNNVGLVGPGDGQLLGVESWLKRIKSSSCLHLRVAFKHLQPRRAMSRTGVSSLDCESPLSCLLECDGLIDPKFWKPHWAREEGATHGSGEWSVEYLPTAVQNNLNPSPCPSENAL